MLMPIRQFEPKRAVEIIALSYGSGYRLGDRLVLTAAHLLGEKGSGCEIRDTLSFGTKVAKVVWKAEGLDIALIELPASIAGVEPVTLGRLPEDKNGDKLAFQMYGYPFWAQTVREEGRAAGGRQIEGTINLADRSADKLLVLEPERLPPESTKSEWAGVSGAAIICDGLVIAVQSQHQNPSRAASLEAAPLWLIYADEQWQKLLEKHNVNPELKIARLQALANGEEDLIKGLQFLEQKNYQEAAKALRKAMETDPSMSKVYYYLAIALLDGKRPQKVDEWTLKKVEEILRVAVDKDADPAKCYALWAIVRYEFYNLNKYIEPSPSSSQLFSQSENLMPEFAKEILAHVKAHSKNIYWQKLNSRFSDL